MVCKRIVWIRSARKGLLRQHDKRITTDKKSDKQRAEWKIYPYSSDENSPIFTQIKLHQMSKCFHIVQRTITNSNWMNENTWHSICIMPIVHALCFVTLASLDILLCMLVYVCGCTFIDSITFTVHFISSEKMLYGVRARTCYVSSKILPNSTNQSHERKIVCRIAEQQ